MLAGCTWAITNLCSGHKRAFYQCTPLHLAKKIPLGRGKKCQGMTLVVPKPAKIDVGFSPCEFFGSQ